MLSSASEPKAQIDRAGSSKLGERAEHMNELVSTPRRLGCEIAPVAGVDRTIQRHPPADLNARAREPFKLARVISPKFLGS